MARRQDYVLPLTPEELARYRSMAARAQEDESADWASAGLVPGARIADVGCGPCALAVVLAGIVGPSGTVDAVDREPSALLLAAEVIATAGISNIRLSRGEANASGLSSEHYDLVMLRHVLAHNGGREREIVGHLATLVRPGGWVYVLDIEATAIRSVNEPPDLTDLFKRYRALHVAMGNDPSIGLRLGDLLAGAGLTDVHHRGWYSIDVARPGTRPPAWAAVPAMIASGVAGLDDVVRWQRAFDAVDRAPSRPTTFVPIFSARGRRPS